MQACHEDFLGVFVPRGTLAPRFRQLVQLPPLGLQLLLGQEQLASWDAVQVIIALAPTAILIHSAGLHCFVRHNPAYAEARRPVSQ